MKKLLIICLLLLPLALPAQENILERRVSVSLENVPLTQLLEQIMKSADVLFLYRSADIQASRKVSFSAADEPLSTVLSRLGIAYEVDGRQIILKKSRDDSPSAATPALPAREITISGTVISSQDDQPVIGATVFVEGTSTGVITDIDGNYSLTVPAGTREVSFSCMGYLTKVIKVGTSLAVFKAVSLDEATQELADAVIVAFGTAQRKETMVSSVESVKPDILRAPTSNLSTSFAGNIAGVIATQSSGEPGSDGSNFWIRGISTFGANKEPLYVMDGVEISKEILNGVPAESIESFSVLKDAAATALYGSRGANGVMIITTKSGRVADRMAINVNVNTTMNMPTSLTKVADAVTYMQAYNEARTGRGELEYFSQEKIDGTRLGTDPYIYPSVDWYSLLFKNWSLSQQANINVRGGGNRVDYFLNAAFNNQDGMLNNAKHADFNTNISHQKFTFQSNVTAKVTSTTVATVKMNAQFLFWYAPTTSTSDLFRYTLTANPATFPAIYPRKMLDDADFAVFGNAPSWDGSATDTNPYAYLCRGYSNKFTGYTTTTVKLDQDLKFITPGLKIWGQASFFTKTYSAKYYNTKPHYYQLSGYYYNYITKKYDYELSQIGAEGSKYLSYSSGKNGSQELSLQANLEYNRTFGNHTVGAVMLYHQKETNNNQPTNYYESLSQREQGIAGRLSYGYGDRYLLEANFGYNGSENFMRGKRWGFFPSVAVGWIVSNEPFWSGIKPYVNLFKFRYSYGLSGNDYLSTRFPYVTEIEMNYLTYFYTGTNFNQLYGNRIATLGNEDATWEVSRKHNIGIELGIYNDLNLIVDLFRENRTGIFMQRQTLPSTIGLTGITPYGNLGAVLNQGIDISAEYHHAFDQDWSVTARGTFTYAHNEVVANDESPYKQYYYTSKIGKPINSVFGLVADGLFKDEADIASSPRQTYMPDYLPGDIKYRDLNGDGIIDDNDRTYLGNPTVPEIIYGFGASLRWKNIDFSFFFQGRGKVSIYMEDIQAFRDNESQGFNVLQWIVADHWSPSHPDVSAAYPRLDYRYNANNTQISSFWMRDGSFLRLKNLEVGYNFKFVRVYLSGTNLFTISPFRYWDPEMGSGNGLSYPLQRTVQLGAQFNF